MRALRKTVAGDLCDARRDSTVKIYYKYSERILRRTMP